MTIRTPMILILLTIAFGLLLIGGGCATVRVEMATPEALTSKATVLVMPLDDTPAGHSISDFTLFGKTGGQGTGAPVARKIARALDKAGVYSAIHRDTFRKTIAKRGIALRDLATTPRETLMSIATEAKADILITGTVDAYSTTWILFIPRVKTAFTITATEVATKTKLWRATFNDGATFSRDTTLVRNGAQEIAQELLRLRTPSTKKQ
jgi:hypothetical protein